MTKVFHFARFDVAALQLLAGHRGGPALLHAHGQQARAAPTPTATGSRTTCSSCSTWRWTRPPATPTGRSDTLGPEQVRYAISDVTLLLPLKDKLDAMLEREGRGTLAQRVLRAIPTFAQLDLLGFVNLLEH